MALQPAITKARPVHDVCPSVAGHDSLQVRPATPADRELLLGMYRGFDPLGAAQGLPPRNEEARRIWIDRALEEEINVGAFSTAGCLAGHTFLASSDAGEAELAVFVHQAHRRRGVGTALARAVLQRADHLGLRRILATMASENIPALRLLVSASAPRGSPPPSWSWNLNCLPLVAAARRFWPAERPKPLPQNALRTPLLAKWSSGEPHMSLQQAITEFRGQFRGAVLEPGDAAYEEARKVYNGMIDRRPRLIAKCTDVADVMAAVRMAKTNALKVSIRGGGHNAAGLGVCDDGLVIDLAPIHYVRVDPASRTVLVGAGCKWSDVDHATHAFGLAVPSGIISSTGVAGLTLGGGMGHLTRKYGLTIDNLLAVDMVLADGSFVVASADENADLFWAVRGGGGNFGIVTSFLFEAHPVGTVCAGPMLWNLDDAADVMKWYREFITQAPEEMNGFFAMMSVPPGPPFPEELHLRKMCAIVWCYQGSMEQANTILESIRSYRPPAFEFFVPMPFPMLQGMFDGIYPPGLQWYWKADFFKELSDAAIEKHLEHGKLLPTWQSTMHLYPVNGKVNRVGESDTAFSYRDAVWSEVIVGVDPDPANARKITEWARAYYDALHPLGAGGAYLNFMMEEGEDRIRATYRGNYDRLAAVKAKYDPGNFFRVNQNIRPAA